VGQGSASRSGRSYSRERPCTHGTGGWVDPRPVWIGAKNLAPPHQDSIPRPSSPSQSLYRLSYRAPQHYNTRWIFFLYFILISTEICSVHTYRRNCRSVSDYTMNIQIYQLTVLVLPLLSLSRKQPLYPAVLCHLYVNWVTLLTITLMCLNI
jgi:hypothetical protein